MMSGSDDIFKLLGTMTLEDTLSSSSSSSSSSGKLKKKKEALVLRKLCAGGGVKKKEKKKGEVVGRKLLSGGGVEKKKKKKIGGASAGTVEHRRRVGLVKMWNKGPGKHLRRMYYGVERSALGTMFLAEISHPDGRLLSLGTFKSDRQAAIPYDQAAVQIYGPNTPLNFPPPTAINNNNN